MPTRFHYTYIKVPTGSEYSRHRIPLMRAESGVAGPTVWLTACAHGDEVGGMVVIQEVFRRFRKTGLVRGAVHALPLMNPIGFESGSRQITMSKEDLNRAFPGNAKGSLAQRIAHKIYNAIVTTEPDLALDLHNDWRRSIPYVLMDKVTSAVSTEVRERSLELSDAAGFAVVIDSESLHSSLSHSLLLGGIPAVTLELGEAHVVNETNVALGVSAIWNLLAELELVEAPTQRFTYVGIDELPSKRLYYSDRPMASTSGITRFLVKPGERVRSGQAIARIYGPFGRPQETLLAERDGIVLGISDSAVAFPGAHLVALGTLSAE